jgi:hypothetical protein
MNTQYKSKIEELPGRRPTLLSTIKKEQITLNLLALTQKKKKSKNIMAIIFKVFERQNDGD